MAKNRMINESYIYEKVNKRDNMLITSLTITHKMPASEMVKRFDNKAV